MLAKHSKIEGEGGGWWYEFNPFHCHGYKCSFAVEHMYHFVTFTPVARLKWYYMRSAEKLRTDKMVGFGNLM